MPKGVYERNTATIDDDERDIPSLIVPKPPAIVIDTTLSENAPDLPDGEWSKKHLVQFLARQEKDLVVIQKESWEPRNEDCFAVVGLQGHWFRIKKNVPAMVPVQIAEIIHNSQQEFSTSQARLRQREITDITEMSPDQNGRGVLGPEVFV